MQSNPHLFVETLQSLPPLENVFNPWRDWNEQLDIDSTAPGVRADNLKRYLAARVATARVVFIGEAPGYLGARFSGIAMTSERILLGGKAPIAPDYVFDGEKARTSSPALYSQGATEMTASIAWGLLLSEGLAPNEFVFWNAFPCHPHRPGEPLSNRAPKPHELKAYRHVLPELLALLPTARAVAVGRVAQKTLLGLGVQAPAVRHPAMGGANQFREEVRSLLNA